MNSTDDWKKEAIRLSAIDPLKSSFSIGHYHLLHDNASGCIKAFSIAVDIISKTSGSEVAKAIASEIIVLGNIDHTNPKLTDQIKLYLNISLFLSAEPLDKASFKNFLKKHKKHKKPFKSPVVIIAGGASKMDIKKTETYHDFLFEIMAGFGGTIISGGTTAGIPGLVGEVKAELEKQGALDFSLIAYLPRELPANALKSVAYDSFYETGSNYFSVQEILSYWCDIVSNGIHPTEVTLLGIEGGVIAALEYRIALSLGAKVALVADSGRAVSDLLHDEAWRTHPNLIILTDDPLSLQALTSRKEDI